MDITDLLNQDPDLAELVAEAADRIVGFIPSARLRLELLSDPDYGDSEQLFLGITTSLDEHEALKALCRFDRAWWVHQAYRAHGPLCIDLADYQSFSDLRRL